jgi:sialate O-acetylesterase
MTLPGITILDAPQDWQILQRGSDGCAAIRLRLAGDPGPHGPGASVQARLVEEATGAALASHLDWTPARADGSIWTLDLERVPAGGLYRLETRLARPGASGDRRALRGDCRHHLGVGDLWLIAGQSNASGTGKGVAEDAPELGLHLFGNDERWRLATHPLEDATASRHPVTVTGIFHGHSPWLAFARRLRTRTGIPVGLIPTALGGSPLKRWINDDGSAADLTANLLSMARLAGSGRVAGIVWHQGESDANADAAKTYAVRFSAWTALVRRELGDPGLPIITGQLNAHVGGNPAGAANWDAIREHQRALAHTIPRIACLPTVDEPLSDEVHNSAAANLAIGLRYADAALALVHGQALPWRSPEAVAASWVGSDRTRIRLRIEARSGDWTPTPAITDCTFSDCDGAVAVTTMALGDSVEMCLARPAKTGAMVRIHAGLAPRPTLRDDAGRCLLAASLALPD